MSDEQLVYSLARTIAEHELRRMGLREEERDLSVASLTYSYLELARQLAAQVRAVDADEPQTEADLDALIAAYAADAEDAQVALERAMKLVTLCDPRRHRLWLASQKAREMAEALGDGVAELAA